MKHNGQPTITTTPNALRSILDRPSASPTGEAAAAVATVMRPDSAGCEVLLIRRATRPGDPWSGQMAFPGGRSEPDDPDLGFTAQRETREEVGLDLLEAGARDLGALTTLQGGQTVKRITMVAARVFWLDSDPGRLSPNEEVDEALWVPLGQLADPARHIDYHYHHQGTDLVFPGIQLDGDGQVVWGLTLRFLADLFRRMNQPFIEIPPLER